MDARVQAAHEATEVPAEWQEFEFSPSDDEDSDCFDSDSEDESTDIDADACDDECINGAIMTSAHDKVYGSTAASASALIHIPMGTRMCKGGHADAYETATRIAQPHSVVTAAQRQAAQAMGAAQGDSRAKYQQRATERRPARSNLPPKAGEDLRVQKAVRYHGPEFSKEQYNAVQRRRKSQLSSKDAKLHQKGAAQNEARALGQAAGGAGKKKGKKAAAAATKGKGGAKKATGTAKGKRTQRKGKQGTASTSAKGVGGTKGTRAAPGRNAKRKAVYVESDSDFSDYEDSDDDYGSKSDLGWAKKPFVR